jgi:leucyl-tRNA synthetase
LVQFCPLKFQLDVKGEYDLEEKNKNKTIEEIKADLKREINKAETAKASFLELQEQLIKAEERLAKEERDLQDVLAREVRFLVVIVMLDEEGHRETG